MGTLLRNALHCRDVSRYVHEPLPTMAIRPSGSLHFAVVPLGLLGVRLNASRTDREHRFAAVELVAGPALAAHRTGKGLCQPRAFGPCGGASRSNSERADVAADASAAAGQTIGARAGVRGNAFVWRIRNAVAAGRSHLRQRY